MRSSVVLINGARFRGNCCESHRRAARRRDRSRRQSGQDPLADSTVDSERVPPLVTLAKEHGRLPGSSAYRPDEAWVSPLTDLEKVGVSHGAWTQQLDQAWASPLADFAKVGVSLGALTEGLPQMSPLAEMAKKSGLSLAALTEGIAGC